MPLQININSSSMFVCVACNIAYRHDVMDTSIDN